MIHATQIFLHGEFIPVPAHHLVEKLFGNVDVATQGFGELEETLLALLDEYEKDEYEKGDATRRAAVRKLVITAKDHARWALRRGHATKEEMVLWMMTWLENPPVFREWVKLRRAQLGSV